MIWQLYTAQLKLVCFLFKLAWCFWIFTQYSVTDHQKYTSYFPWASHCNFTSYIQLTRNINDICHLCTRLQIHNLLIKYVITSNYNMWIFCGCQNRELQIIEPLAFLFILLQLMVTTEIICENVCHYQRESEKKYIWSLFTKNTKPLNYPHKREKGFRAHLTRADIRLLTLKNKIK